MAALVAVNSVGSVTMPGSRTMWAWHLEQAGELGGQAAPRDATGHAFETKRGIGMNTTIGVVATDAVLDHGGVQRLAAMAQGGYAYAIRPIHTPYRRRHRCSRWRPAPCRCRTSRTRWCGWVRSPPTWWRAR